MRTSPSALRPRLILASASPRRRELLASLGLHFDVIPSDVDETLPDLLLDPCRTARRLAAAKAEAVARQHPDAVVIGADTLVCLGSRSLAKPTDEADAIRMLRLLSGKTHRVITGIAVCAKGRTARASETTWVTFRPLMEQEILEYARTGEPLDKAGAYGIQAGAGSFVARVEGCYNNVVGLPVARLVRLLRWAGVLE